MGEIDINRAEITLLVNGKKRAKLLNGDYGEVVTLEKFVRIRLSDGTEYFAEVKLVPRDITPGDADWDGVVYENFLLEGYGILDDGAGKVVHQKRGYI